MVKDFREILAKLFGRLRLKRKRAAKFIYKSMYHHLCGCIMLCHDIDHALYKTVFLVPPNPVSLGYNAAKIHAACNA